MAGHENEKPDAANIGQDAGSSREGTPAVDNIAAVSAERKLPQDELSARLLNTAIGFAKKHYPVFPCVPGDKKPLTSHGFKDATCDENQIRAWWAENPLANIGMPTGSISGISVVDADIDVIKGTDGVKALEELAAKHGGLPATYTIKTPRSGKHRWYKHREGFKSTAGKLAPGIDTRGDGGYVILPSSRTCCGAYFVEYNHPLAQLPAWLYDAVLNPRKASSAQNLAGGAIPASSSLDRQADRKLALECLRHLKASRADNYQDWILVGMVLKDVGCACEDWVEWSKQSEKFEPGVCEIKWESFS